MTICMICKNPIYHDDEVVGFQAFVRNTLDPLWFFSDSKFHSNCFYKHPLASLALERYRELEKHHSPESRICAISGLPIESFDDFFMLGFLTDDVDDPLYRYNYFQCRYSLLHTWKNLEEVFNLISQLNSSGKWGGKALENISMDLKEAIEKRNKG